MVIIMTEQEVYEKLVNEKIYEINKCINERNISYEVIWSEDGGGFIWNYDLYLIGNKGERLRVIDDLYWIDNIDVRTSDDYGFEELECDENDEEIFIYIDLENKVEIV